MEQLNITTHPAELAVNYSTVSAGLDKQLAYYRALVVTPDNIQDAKKSATEVNRFAADIDKRRKDAVREVSKPIKDFEDQMKALHAQCKDARQTIVDQVARFEDQVREQAEQLLIAALDALWDKHDLQPDYRRAEYVDLITLSAVTGTGKLAKAPRDAIESRVRDDKALQDRVERRLIELERDSYRAGLDAPLTRAYVESFLFADDDTYARQLQRLIDAELQRQQQAAARREQKAAKRHEAEEAARRAQGKCDGNHAAPACTDPECWHSDAPATQQLAPAPAAPAVDMPDAPDGREVWRVTVVFPISCKAGVDAQRIKKAVTTRLTNAGIDTPAYMEAVREAEPEAENA